MIFVFGSNLAGRHGAGAALYARKYKGAVYGQGVGLQGQSYAIPTKDKWVQTLPLNEINEYVQEFIKFAADHPELKFELTAIGCGLAGYSPKDIAPMFKWIESTNIQFPFEFIEFFKNNP
jgi:aldehyde:ferredoxin oxidoreductase